MKTRLIAPLAVALVLISGCALPEAASPPGRPAGESSVAPAVRTGNVEIRVTDAPRHDDVTEIWVKVSEVQIHKGSENEESDGGWMSANITDPNPFELLRLRDGGIQQILGNTHLDEGKYTQIRMTVDNVTVKVSGETREATVPSGKIKFIHPFEVKEGQTTVLLFDFDAEKSVNVTGSDEGNGKVLFKPVIKLTSSRDHETGTSRPDAQSVRITTPALPNGSFGTPYSAVVQAAGGTAPYAWSIANGSLPGGLTINAATGEISGLPTASGSFQFSVKVTDNSTSPKSGKIEYGVNIAPQGSLIVLTTFLPDATTNTSYGPVAIQAAGGAPPYHWSLISGTLPHGLSFDLVSGIISGSPTNPGDHHFTIQVTDNSAPANTYAQALSLKVK